MTQILYRNDNYDNSEGIVRKLQDIIVYEINELGNSDILEYCNDHYQLSDELTDDIDNLIEQIQNDEEFNEALVKYIANKLVKEISEETHKILRFGLWLADKKAVKDFYDGTDENITGYEVSDVILSDLGEDGKLFAYEFFPCPVE